jgi:prevent-host-death family protein
MNTYTYSQARQKLADLLDEAYRQGRVQLKRRNGQTFLITPVEDQESPLDVEGVQTNISLDDINKAVHKSRGRRYQ